MPLSPMDEMAQAARLEHFRRWQEAAKGFDDVDDIEFCPTLTAEELAQFRSQVSALVSSAMSNPHSSLSSTSPPQQWTRAIPIVDPMNKTPLTFPSKTTTATKSYTRPVSPFNPATTNVTSLYSTAFNPYSSPTPSYSTMATSFPWQHHSPPAKLPSKGKFSVPIVDPVSGNTIIPNVNSYHHQHQYDISVR